MALSKQNPLMEKSHPVIWVQDRKNGNVGGGFMTTADTWYTRDLNWIGKNTITGAGIKPDNTTLHTTKGFFGADVGRATPINSPTTGTNNQLSRFVLPVGEYFIEFRNQPTGESAAQLYNITDDIIETTIGYVNYSNFSPSFSCYVSVTGASKEFRMENAGLGPVDSIAALGTNEFGASQLISHADIKIYKIG